MTKSKNILQKLPKSVKNDQKLYIVPSQNLVVIRMGEDAGESLLGPSSFDNELWGILNDFIN